MAVVKVDTYIIGIIATNPTVYVENVTTDVIVL